jgi:hypothetical protein
MTFFVFSGWRGITGMEKTSSFEKRTEGLLLMNDAKFFKKRCLNNVKWVCRN